MYLRAIRAASMTASKASAGVARATIGSGDSPWRPYIAMSRSACSVLVGRPVDGPPRCTSMMSMGSSVMMARLIVSLLRARPGPLVPVTPRWPANEAPSAAPAAAIYIDDEHGQLGHDGEADRFALEGEAGAAGPGDAEVAGERGAECGAGGGNLVLGLEGAHAEVPMSRQLMKDVGGGRDRVRGIEHGEACRPARRGGRPPPPPAARRLPSGFRGA